MAFVSNKSGHWFRSLIESTAEPITIIALGSGRIVDVNSAFSEATGFGQDETIGRTPAEMGFLDNPSAYDRLLRAPAGEKIGELEFHTRDGESRIAQISRMAIEVAGQACLIVIWRDITERKQFENDIVRARDLALEAAQLKNDFLSNVSHELRTPLNGIIGLSELLVGTSLTSEQREYANTIEKSSVILLRLVSDILDFSTASSGQLRLERIGFSLPDVIETAVSLYAALAAGKGLKLVSYVDPAIPDNLIGDPCRMGQALSNLLDNAMKFTHSGTVTVRALAVKFSDDSAVVRFEVRDTGIGISPADQYRVFQPFTRADGSTTRKYGGTGLGLAICARLVNAMDGEIGVLSSPGHGSVFHFTARFGLARCDSDRSGLSAPEDTPRLAAFGADCVGAAEPDTQSERARARILIVDDNLTNQVVLRRQLDKLGYIHVTTVDNGLEALKILAERSYDIVLMDCLMPVMDGREATALLRQRERGDEHTRIIAVTAKATLDDCGICLNCGMDDYIAKPVRLEALAAALERWRSMKAPARIAGQPSSAIRTESALGKAIQAG
ncbi:MAG TPA: ATP-binding protein [Candidatus Binataceae bacterium]|nr:ATP-binding protein [Candidatus Binataceae bacterium]